MIKKTKPTITFGKFYGINHKFLAKLHLNDKDKISIKKLLSSNVKCTCLDRIISNKSDFNTIKSFIYLLLYKRK